jgi:hypothetical protein
MLIIGHQGAMSYGSIDLLGSEGEQSSDPGNGASDTESYLTRSSVPLQSWL